MTLMPAMRKRQLAVSNALSDRFRPVEGGRLIAETRWAIGQNFGAGLARKIHWGGNSVTEAIRYRQNSRGTVTAEFAVALPAVIFLLALLLAGSAAGITQLRIEEAARAGARSLARGDSAATVQGTVSRLAGDGALSTVDADGDWLKVTVTAPVGGPLGKLIPWTLTASASSRTELPVSAYGHLAEVRAEGLRRKDSA